MDTRVKLTESNLKGIECEVEEEKTNGGEERDFLYTLLQLGGTKSKQKRRANLKGTRRKAKASKSESPTSKQGAEACLLEGRRGSKHSLH
jgi:hypothetical protein